MRHLIALAFLAWSATVSAQTLTIDNVTIVDVSTGRLSPRSTILIDGNRIVGIEPRRAARGRTGEAFDGTGMFVIPGLWDMHVHAYGSNASDLTLPLFIANGVTGVRDMGSSLDAVLAARDRITAHQMIGPRLFVAGPMLDGPAARGQVSTLKVGTPDEARAAVQILKQRGVDFIKTQSLIPRDVYFAIADESRRLGMSFEGHVPDAVRAVEAIKAGQRSFEHLLGILQATTTREDSIVARGIADRAALLASFSAERERRIIAEVARGRVWQCPTIASDLNTAADLAADPALAYWKRGGVEGWRTYARQILDSTETTALNERFARYELDLVRKLRAANVPFLAGTDAPEGLDLVPGASIHRELEWFVSTGFTPLEALQTATLNPAVYLGRTRDFGAVAAGKLADVVLLTRNPLVDIRNTRSVAAVVADGRFYSPKELDRLRFRLMEDAAK